MDDSIRSLTTRGSMNTAEVVWRNIASLTTPELSIAELSIEEGQTDAAKAVAYSARNCFGTKGASKMKSGLTRCSLGTCWRKAGFRKLETSWNSALTLSRIGGGILPFLVHCGGLRGTVTSGRTDLGLSEPIDSRCDCKRITTIS